MTTPKLVVYSRRGCHLCEVLIEEVLPLIRGRMELEVRDVDTRTQWIEAYSDKVPVVEYAGSQVCQYHLDREALRRLLP